MLWRCDAEASATHERHVLSKSGSVFWRRHCTSGDLEQGLILECSHRFDHTYVEDAMRKHPARLKGMCLANPAQSADEACAELERLHQRGFVGIRFNPGLWSDGKGMDDEVSVGVWVCERKREECVNVWIRV